jgi:hypothetical protein
MKRLRENYLLPAAAKVQGEARKTAARARAISGHDPQENVGIGWCCLASVG